jgi:hypothetical protein
MASRGCCFMLLSLNSSKTCYYIHLSGAIFSSKPTLYYPCNKWRKFILSLCVHIPPKCMHVAAFLLWFVPFTQMRYFCCPQTIIGQYMFGFNQAVLFTFTWNWLGFVFLGWVCVVHYPSLLLTGGKLGTTIVCEVLLYLICTVHDNSAGVVTAIIFKGLVVMILADMLFLISLLWVMS